LSNDDIKSGVNRRDFIQHAGAATFLAGTAPAIIPSNARAQPKTLKILRWKHFVPGFDTWFEETFVPGWEAANDTKVELNSVERGNIPSLADADVNAGKGHDLVLFLAPRPSLEEHAIDHREIYEECEQRYGKAIPLAERNTYNPRTDRYHGFCEGFVPTVLSYRQDLWDAVGEQPDSWDDILKGGRKIKLLHGKPVGISLAAEANSNHSLRALLYAYGASVQDADGRPTLKSKETLEAIKFGKALYEEAMSDVVLTWDATSNNSFILSEEGSLTIDTLSIARAAENKALPVDPHLALARLPEGPAGRIGPDFGTYINVIWKFAENIDGAKQFLVDYVGSSKAALLAAGFQNMPSFPDAVPDLAELLASDPVRPERYRLLTEVFSTMTNIGHPGYANAAIDDVFEAGVIPNMFARAATGALTPEEALDEADKAIAPIFDKWREAGKL